LKVVYIASPYHADTPEEMERNKQAALGFCAEVYRLGRLAGERFVPVTPLVNFPYLNENDPKERDEAMKMGLALLSQCDQLWVAGDRISTGMRGEIQVAVRMDKPVYSMGLAQETIQAVIADMPPLLNKNSCFKNSAREDYSGQLLVLKASALAPWAKNPENQLWIADGIGFGARPNAHGRAVYAQCLYDGEEARWNRSDFCGIANPHHIPSWAREKFEEYQQQEQNQDHEESEELEP
jgi:hypothetical protein